MKIGKQFFSSKFGLYCKDIIGLLNSNLYCLQEKTSPLQYLSFLPLGNALKYQQETPKQRILAALKDIELLEQQDKAVKAVQALADAVRPDDIDTTVNVPSPRPKRRSAMALSAVLAFILNII